VSHVLPPSWSGQAVVIYRLLRDLEPGSYCLISRQNCAPSGQEETSSGLPVPHYHLPAEFRIRGAGRLGLEVGSDWLRTFQRARHIARIVKQERVEAVVACSGDLYDLPASYLASRWVGVQCYPYLFDDYIYQWAVPTQRSFAQRFAPRLFRGAAGVIVPNEFLRDEYRCRYGIEPVVIHNPCADSQGDLEQEAAWPADPGEITIVYTGAVYHAHYDAFRNLIAALEQLGRPRVKLHLYTAQPAADLDQEGISGSSVIQHPHLPESEVSAVQRRADILFLPLAFDSLIPEVIRTSAPGKLGEYLTTGRPTLAHAPADSFVAWYLKEYACGLVVDRSEASLLARALRRILDDADLRQRLGANALARARIDFSQRDAQARFMKLLQTRTV